jgi:hypothetical protein
MWTHTEKTQLKIIAIEHRYSVAQRHLFSFSQQGFSQCGKLPQGAGTLSKPRDIEHPRPPSYGWVIWPDRTGSGFQSPKASNNKTHQGLLLGNASKKACHWQLGLMRKLCSTSSQKSSYITQKKGCL